MVGLGLAPEWVGALTSERCYDQMMTALARGSARDVNKVASRELVDKRLVATSAPDWWSSGIHGLSRGVHELAMLR